MARWRKVDAGTWGDRRFAGLSERAKLLWMYLLTGPDVTSLPGLLIVGRGHLAEALGWDTRAFDRVFAELGASNEDGQPMAEADWQARVVWLPAALKHNKPPNPSVVRGWRDHWRVLPECELKQKATEVLAKGVADLGEDFATMFATMSGMVWDTVSGTMSNTVSGTMSNTVVTTVKKTVSRTVQTTVPDTKSTPSLARTRASLSPVSSLEASLLGVQGGPLETDPVTLDEPIGDTARSRVETIAMTRGWRPTDIGGEWLKYLGKVATKRPRSELEGGWQKWLLDAEKYAKQDARRDGGKAGALGPPGKQKSNPDAPWLKETP